MTTPSFQIRITKRVTFRDMHGTITADYPVGTLLKATAKDNHYFVTSMGGIWRDEAEEVV
jgi:hypothetical protein